MILICSISKLLPKVLSHCVLTVLYSEVSPLWFSDCRVCVLLYMIWVYDISSPQGCPSRGSTGVENYIEGTTFIILAFSTEQLVVSVLVHLVHYLQQMTCFSFK